MPKVTIPINAATERKRAERAKREGCTVEEIIESAIEALLGRRSS